MGPHPFTTQTRDFCAPARGFLPTFPVSASSPRGREEEGQGGGLYLDGGDEGSGEVGAETRGQTQLADVLVFSQGTGNRLLAEQLQAGHPVLYSDHVQGRA